MFNNNIIIKSAFLAKTTGQLDYNYGLSPEGFGKIISAEFQIVREITAVVDQENQEIIDIETHEVFPIAQRDEFRRIKGLDSTKLENDKIVALHLLDKEWDKMSMLYQLELRSRAKKVYKRYLEDKQRNNSGPTLTKKRESK